jgi:hypothetical protein
MYIMVNCKELRDLAKELKIRGYSKMNKQQLVDAVEGYAKATKPADPVEAPSQPKDTEPTEAPTPAPPKKARSSTSPWVAFCREYSKEQGIPYKEAMKSKDQYLEWKSKRSEKNNVETE